MIVVDTNIIAYLWLPSDYSELSDTLFQSDPEWVAPVLWKSEFRNVVTLYLKRKLIGFTEAVQITERAETQMRDREYHLNSVQVYNLVEKSDCSSYDCEFVSLAEELNVKLVTMDRQILQSFPGRAVDPGTYIGSI